MYLDKRHVKWSVDRAKEFRRKANVRREDLKSLQYLQDFRTNHGRDPNISDYFRMQTAHIEQLYRKYK